MKKLMLSVMALGLAGMLLSAGMLYQRNTDSKGSAQAFEAMSSQLQLLISAKAEEQATAAATQRITPMSLAAANQLLTLPETEDPALLSYRQMAQTQPDMVGWLQIDGTAIDYPVMRSPQEPERYLHMDYSGQYSRAGTPFMLPISDPSVPNENIIIYAHHMKDGSMFGSLPTYETLEAYQAQPYIRFDTLYERGLYKIVAVFRTSVGAQDEFPYYLYEWLDSEESFDRYMRGVMDNRLYDTGETAEYGDRLLSLSTCDYHEPNGRLVVVAKKVIETEDVENAA